MSKFKHLFIMSILLFTVLLTGCGGGVPQQPTLSLDEAVQILTASTPFTDYATLFKGAELNADLTAWTGRNVYITPSARNELSGYRVNEKKAFFEGAAKFFGENPPNGETLDTTSDQHIILIVNAQTYNLDVTQVGGIEYTIHFDGADITVINLAYVLNPAGLSEQLAKWVAFPHAIVQGICLNEVEYNLGLTADFSCNAATLTFAYSAMFSGVRSLDQIVDAVQTAIDAGPFSVAVGGMRGIVTHVEKFFEAGKAYYPLIPQLVDQ